MRFMQKYIKSLIVIVWLLNIMNFISRAQDLNSLTDKFYLGLAQIIEENMGSPNNCVKAVNKYYEEQKVLVEQIRNEAKKAFEKMAPMIEEYMDEEASLGEDYYPQGAGRKAEEVPMSEAMTAYSAALEKFTAKYPRQGLEISMKALELLPPYDVEE